MQVVDSEHTPCILFRTENAKYAVNFAEIPRKAQDIVTVAGETRPLGLVLNCGIPEKRIAYRRDGRLDILGNHVCRRRTDIEPGQPVEDHRYCVESRRPPRSRWKCTFHQRVIGQMPCFYCFP